MKRIAVGLLIGALGFLGACGNDCGLGTTAVNGLCIVAEPDHGSCYMVLCGLGTHCAGNECVPDRSPDPTDVIQGPDLPTPRDVPSLDAATDTSLPIGCPPGTKPIGSACEPFGTPKIIALTDVHRAIKSDAADAAFAMENGHLIVYWSQLSVAGTATSLPDQGMLDFPIAKQEFDPVAMAFVGSPETVIELGSQALSPDISGDGQWLTFTCQNRFFGGQGSDDDLCIASRADASSPWGGVRPMAEINTTASDSDPTFQNDPTTGIAKFIYWTGPRGGTRVKGGGALCFAPFDATSGKAVPDDPNIPCVPVQSDTRGDPATQFIIDDPIASENCAAWSVDGQFFAWSRESMDTLGFDIWIGQSTQKNGIVDRFIGQLPNTTSNDLGFTFAPFGAPDNAKSLVMWQDIDDLTTLMAGSSLHVARMPDPTSVMP